MEAIIDYRGKTPTKTAVGIPLITAKVVKRGRIETPAEFISVDDYDAWMRRGTPRVGDVIVTTEAPLGEVAQLRSERVALAQRLITLRGKTGLLDNGFLRFLMQSDYVQEQLHARASGTTVLGIKQAELRKIQLLLPPFDEQRAIANVLGTLDDKIELNRKMNRTLEESAQTLFRAWFVDFEEETDLVESEVGLIPRGWEPTTLGDFAENIRNGVDPDEQPPGTPYIGLGHMTPGSITGYSWGRAADVGSTKLAFQEGDLLFGKLRAYFKKVLVAPFEGICSSDILVIRPKHEKWFGLVLGLLTDDRFIEYADGASTGTRMPRVNWKTLARYQVAVPNDLSLVTEYSSLVRTLVARLTHNIFESRTLAEIRDTLLPKLISGEIRVPEAEEVVEEAV